ncbi:replication protein A 14 kDa subunit-like [Octopus sinensis]|uniref:Replication protein A 14 kDa subunit-like n=1 Tax=Octopus sinensis TaxID=2607531 RepID=A0A6P7SPA4_9MOLL|nr:replication protein A 14 kDa subunit-like [Octopus sinensis]
MSTLRHVTSRINGSMMPKFQGRKACLLGIAQGVDSSGLSFKLKTCDDVNVSVYLAEPLNEYVGGLTEVFGEVSSNSSMNCQDYVLFTKEQTDSFDMEMYNTAVEMISKYSDHYKVGV